MNIDLNLILYIGIPVITALATYVARSFLGRLEAVEEKMQHSTTEPQVRQLIADRYDPLVQDIREIKDTLNKLIEIAIKNNKGE